VVHLGRLNEPPKNRWRLCVDCYPLTVQVVLPPQPPRQVRKAQKRSLQFTDPGAPEYSLTDILTPANVIPLFTSHPELVPTLFPHLPSDLPNPPNAETVSQIIGSPQFRSAVSNLDQALRTGLLGGFVRSLGLPEEAGTSVQAFLRAIQDQVASEDSMQTD
jgi:hypothetical protein